MQCKESSALRVRPLNETERHTLKERETDRQREREREKEDVSPQKARHTGAHPPTLPPLTPATLLTMFILVLITRAIFQPLAIQQCTTLLSIDPPAIGPFLILTARIIGSCSVLKLPVINPIVLLRLEHAHDAGGVVDEIAFDLLRAVAADPTKTRDGQLLAAAVVVVIGVVGGGHVGEGLWFERVAVDFAYLDIGKSGTRKLTPSFAD